jgi:hypothetical protein
MKIKISLITGFMLAMLCSFSQNNSLVLNNNAFIVMDGGVIIVVDQPHQDGIVTLGTGGYIVSEDENNKIRWEISTSTGVYTVPFTTTPVIQGGNETKIPYTLQVQSAGVGAAGRVDFSTYETSTDMNVPWASTVTHMNDADMVNTDNSLYVVDRFWFIDANNYATKPDPLMVFGYDDNVNEIGGANIIVEANLVAQRFDDGSLTWNGDFSNSVNFWGTANAGTNLVSGVDVAASNFFAAWVLVNRASILPVELVNFEGHCVDGNSVKLNWTTESESNNSYFTIEKSMDGLSWSVFSIVDGAGNSTEYLEYILVDQSPFPLTYYRIKQTDYDGRTKIIKSIHTDNCGLIEDGITVTPNMDGAIEIKITTERQTNFTITLYDMRGRQVSNSQNIFTTNGENTFSFFNDVSFGLYTIVINSDSQKFVKKIALN